MFVSMKFYIFLGMGGGVVGSCVCTLHFKKQIKMHPTDRCTGKKTLYQWRGTSPFRLYNQNYHFMDLSTLSIIVAVIVLAVLFVMMSYVKAPPSYAFIISGLSREPRVLIGSGGFRIPYLERLDKVYLGQITVDIKTEESVPTNDFINVDVDAVAKIRVTPTSEGTRLAAKNFLNMSPTEIAEQLQDSLQGNMREIIGTLDLRSLNTDRDGFSDQVMMKASPDMSKLGIEIISCNIQNVTDREGLIHDLGADNTAKIKKEASINRANAERDVKIEVAHADREANAARVDADTAIAIKNNELALKRAALKLQADTAQADADAAYSIQQQEQQKTINIKTVEAESEKTAVSRSSRVSRSRYVSTRWLLRWRRRLMPTSIRFRNRPRLIWNSAREWPRPSAMRLSSRL